MVTLAACWLAGITGIGRKSESQYCTASTKNHFVPVHVRVTSVMIEARCTSDRSSLVAVQGQRYNAPNVVLVSNDFKNRYY